MSSNKKGDTHQQTVGHESGEGGCSLENTDEVMDCSVNHHFREQNLKKIEAKRTVHLKKTPTFLSGTPLYSGTRPPSSEDDYEIA